MRPPSDALLSKRFAAVRRKISSLGGSLVISDPADIEYLTGAVFDDSYLVICGKDTFLVTDLRFEGEAESLRGVSALFPRNGKAAALKGIFDDRSRRPVCLERGSTPLSLYVMLRDRLGDKNVKPVDDILLSLREIKDGYEIERIRKAAVIAEKTLRRVKRHIRPGMTERKLVSLIDSTMIEIGAAGPSFPTIAAFGKNSFRAHARASMSRLRPGDHCLIDMGAVYEGYSSDLTRVLFLPKINRQFRDIYAVLKEAQAIALKAAGPGKVIGTADRKVRKFLKSKGYDTLFTHSLGHGLGRMVHERPYLHSRNRKCFKPGMVFTIEPGVYIKGAGGLRREDICLITERSSEMISDFGFEI